MNCENCGAPMVFQSERDYFFCEYCGSFYFPEQSDDGVRMLEVNEDHLGCPVCQVPLARAALDAYRGYTCPKCKGVLMDRWSFGQLVKFRRSRAKEDPIPAPPLNQKEYERKLACPRCARMMDTHPYYGPGNIVIQTCAKCNLIWLDYGELSQVVNAPGRDRGVVDPRMPIREDEERLEKDYGDDFPFKVRIL